MSGGSSNSSGNFRGMKKNEEGVLGPVQCRCGVVAPCWEAWKDETPDPGRRFFGCSRFKDPKSYCKFFLWADPPYTERAREVIADMKMKLKAKNGEVALLRKALEVAESSNGKEREEIALLKQNLEVAESRIVGVKDELIACRLCYSEYVDKKEKEVRQLKLYVCLVVAVLMVFASFWFCAD